MNYQESQPFCNSLRFTFYLTFESKNVPQLTAYEWPGLSQEDLFVLHNGVGTSHKLRFPYLKN